jgi:type II secretory pathway component GspD/PulD (secretin)
MQANSGKDSAQTVVLVTARAAQPEVRRAAKREAGHLDSDNHELKIFALRYLNATSAVEVLSKLMPDNSLRIAADPRTNSLLANGSSEKLATIGAILLRLDDARDEPPR